MKQKSAVLGYGFFLLYFFRFLFLLFALALGFGLLLLKTMDALNFSIRELNRQKFLLNKLPKKFVKLLMQIFLAKRLNFEDPLIHQHHIQIKLKSEMRGRILTIIFSDQILKKMQLFLVG